MRLSGLQGVFRREAGSERHQRGHASRPSEGPREAARFGTLMRPRHRSLWLGPTSPSDPIDVRARSDLVAADVGCVSHWISSAGRIADHGCAPSVVLDTMNAGDARVGAAGRRSSFQTVVHCGSRKPVHVPVALVWSAAGAARRACLAPWDRVGAGVADVLALMESFFGTMQLGAARPVN